MHTKGMAMKRIFLQTVWPLGLAFNHFALHYFDYDCCLPLMWLFNIDYFGLILAGRVYILDMYNPDIYPFVSCSCILLPLPPSWQRKPYLQRKRQISKRPVISIIFFFFFFYQYLYLNLWIMTTKRALFTGFVDHFLFYLNHCHA